MKSRQICSMLLTGALVISMLAGCGPETTAGQISAGKCSVFYGRNGSLYTERGRNRRSIRCSSIPFLEVVSTPEGQKALQGNRASTISSLKGGIFFQQYLTRQTYKERVSQLTQSTQLLYTNLENTLDSQWIYISAVISGMNYRHPENITQMRSYMRNVSRQLDLENMGSNENQMAFAQKLEHSVRILKEKDEDVFR